MRHSGTLLVAILILLTPTAAAAPVAVGQAASIDVAAASATGSLRGIIGDQTCPTRFSGTAESAHLEIDEIVTNATVVGISPTPAYRHTIKGDATQATIELVSQDTCKIAITPIARGATLTGSPATVTRSGRPAYVYTPEAQATRAETRIDTALSLEMTLSSLSIQGDVRLVFKGTTGNMTAGGVTDSADTGTTIQSVGPAGSPVTRNTEREGYLDLIGANLSVAGPATTFANQVILRSQSGSVTLRDATLSISGVDVQAKAVVIHAPLNLTAAAQPGSVSVSLDDGRDIVADGRTMAPPRIPTSFTWILWLLPLGAVALAAGELVRRRRKVKALVQGHNYANAALVAHSIAWLPVVGRPARVAEVVSLFRTDQLEKARSVLDRRKRWTSMQGTWEFLRAHLYAAQGDRKSARDSLATSLLLNPSYATDARADPQLRDIIEEAIRIANEKRGQRVEGYA